MKRVLIAVDDTKSSKAVLTAFHNLVQKPDEAVLLHVERLEGRSLMIDMLGDAELATLKEAVRGTQYKESLDSRAEEVLDHYRKELEAMNQVRVKTVLRDGIPSVEILKVAEEEAAELIILGYSGRRGLNRLISGSVAKEIGAGAKVPVLVAKKAIMCEEPYRWKDAYAAVSVTTAVIAVLFILGIFLQKTTFLH